MVSVPLISEKRPISTTEPMDYQGHRIEYQKTNVGGHPTLRVNGIEFILKGTESFDSQVIDACVRALLTIQEETGWSIPEMKSRKVQFVIEKFSKTSATIECSSVEKTFTPSPGRMWENPEGLGTIPNPPEEAGGTETPPSPE